MEYMCSRPGRKPSVLAADRDANHALSFASARCMAQASVTDIAESQPANLVYSFIPKHLHPLEILNVIAHRLPADVAAPVNQEKPVVSVPPTSGPHSIARQQRQTMLPAATCSTGITLVRRSETRTR